MEFLEFSDFLNTVMAHNGFASPVEEDKSRKLHFLMEHMLEINKSMNLTAIREEKAVIVRHFLDSLTILPFLPQNAKMLDVGCGAGFPCLPVGIFREDLAITALDSTEKRIKYVRDTANALKLPCFVAIAARAEALAHEPTYREAFDVVTARAVAALPTLAELCLPFVRVGGSFIAMKATRGEEELTAAKSAIAKLGGKVDTVKTVYLKSESEQDERILIKITKIAKTPTALPRAYAKMIKNPL